MAKTSPDDSSSSFFEKWKKLIIGLCIGTVITGLGFGLGFGLSWSSCDTKTTTTAVNPTSTSSSTTTTMTTTKPPTTADPPTKNSVDVLTSGGYIRGYTWFEEGDDDPGLGDPARLVNNEHYSIVFKGIPYAQPPEGEYRWKSPRPIGNWGYNDARYYKPFCAQGDSSYAPTSKEDCLFLNIFVSKESHEKGRKIPVAIWFHGGAFSGGAGGNPLYDARFVAPMMDMVVVTVNYRLGPFGFMALEKTEDGEETNANWGFLDQQESIRWVRKHIDAFGGDPEKIMIFGQSAGGVSTLLHLLYSGDMISSVVSHSNPLAIPMKENWEGQKQAWQFADTAGCISSTITSAEDRNACLRALSKAEVMSVKGQMPQLVNPDRLFTLAMKFLPMVDNSIMHRQPFWDLIDGIYDKNINIMAGSVEHETEIYVRSVWGEPISGAEAIAGVRAIVHDKEKFDEIMERYDVICQEEDYDPTDTDKWGETSSDFDPVNCVESLCEALEICPGPGQSLIEQICESVSDSDCLQKGPKHDDRNTLEEPATDWVFTCPLRMFYKAHAAPNLYAYHFRAGMPIDFAHFPHGGFRTYDRCHEVSCHAADLQYTFEAEESLNCTFIHEENNDFMQCDANGQPEGTMKHAEYKLMERYMHRYWGNFVRNGDPNDETGSWYPDIIKNLYDSDPDLPEWKSFNDGNSYMHFGYNHFTPDDERKITRSEQGFKTEICEFWDGLELYANR